MNHDHGSVTPAIRVVMADEHAALFEGLGSILLNYKIDIVKLTSHPDEITACYAALRPDVLLLDVRFRDNMSGLEIAKNLLTRYPRANIVFLSQYEVGTLIKEAYRLGARAYVNKRTDIPTLVNAIQHAAKGEKYYTPDVDAKYRELVEKGGGAPHEKLRGRELQTFILVAEGFSNIEIAEKLGVSAKTISLDVAYIKTQLGLERNAQLTKLAIQHGLIRLD